METNGIRIRSPLCINRAALRANGIAFDLIRERIIGIPTAEHITRAGQIAECVRIAVRYLFAQRFVCSIVAVVIDIHGINVGIPMRINRSVARNDRFARDNNAAFGLSIPPDKGVAVLDRIGQSAVHSVMLDVLARGRNGAADRVESKRVLVGSPTRSEYYILRDAHSIARLQFDAGRRIPTDKRITRFACIGERVRFAVSSRRTRNGGPSVRIKRYVIRLSRPFRNKLAMFRGAYRVGGNLLIGSERGVGVPSAERVTRTNRLYGQCEVYTDCLLDRFFYAVVAVIENYIFLRSFERDVGIDCVNVACVRTVSYRDRGAHGNVAIRGYRFCGNNAARSVYSNVLRHIAYDLERNVVSERQVRKVGFAYAHRRGLARAYARFIHACGERGFRRSKHDLTACQMIRRTVDNDRSAYGQRCFFRDRKRHIEYIAVLDERSSGNVAGIDDFHIARIDCRTDIGRIYLVSKRRCGIGIIDNFGIGCRYGSVALIKTGRERAAVSHF